MCEGSTNTKGTQIKTIQYKQGEHNGPVVVDDCIAELVETLNRYGIKTLSCCCGNGTGKGSILISLENIELYNLLGECMRVNLKFNSNGDTEIK